MHNKVTTCNKHVVANNFPKRRTCNLASIRVRPLGVHSSPNVLASEPRRPHGQSSHDATARLIPAAHPHERCFYLAWWRGVAAAGYEPSQPMPLRECGQLQVSMNDCLRADLKQFCVPLQVCRRCRRHPADDRHFRPTRGSGQRWACGFLLSDSALTEPIEHAEFPKFPIFRF